MAKIQDFTGNQFLPDSPDYSVWQYQYASSSYQTEHNMHPGLIVQPAGKEDIKRAIAFARQNKQAIAIRTGGHQYSGASSTGAGNVLLDVRRTFKNPDDLVYVEKDGGARGPLVRASVSWALGEFNAFLGRHQCFVPHGQCVSVHVGGHVQTGGYGQLGRSFGLFGDHIRSLEVIDWEGKERELTREADPELFFAWLGGSPGNFGVLTHFTLEVHRDADHVGSRGFRVLHLYSPAKLRELLGYLAQMSDDEAFPRNYDLCVSVLSANADILGLLGGVDDRMQREHPEIWGTDGLPAWPRMIVVYAQWVPFGPDDAPDDGWFDRLRGGSWFAHAHVKPMSELTAEWIFRNDREFELPYVKRTYLTNATDLSTNGWVDWVVGRMDEIVKPIDNGCWLSAQLQCFGGKHSRFKTNADNGTSYSWRSDTTLCFTIDCFHKPDEKDRATAWQEGNDKGAIGPDGIFSKEDRRVLWGSYGNFDLDAVWNCYHEDRPKYERLMRARKAADPEGIFTPNTFCVKRAE